MKATKDAIRRWEANNLLHGTGYLIKARGAGYSKSLSSAMSKRGYEAFRISPRVTKKFGLSYRMVLGAVVSPMKRFNQKTRTYEPVKTKSGRYAPKVEWYRQGYIKAGKKTGSFFARKMTGTFDPKTLKMELMM